MASSLMLFFPTTEETSVTHLGDPFKCHSVWNREGEGRDLVERDLSPGRTVETGRGGRSKLSLWGRERFP